ncbi:protein DBF4 homolog A [Elysia marginata]|uniref:Protein DBF4 homolog A n=1 Tax=Elysia marginata TaxID=1093978 RepID=A0AAV4J3R8_9GAST|nr:protein DBF4 homolog A [Elysia marginata]
MTSNYKRPQRMRTQRERKKPNLQSKKKLDKNVAVAKNLPLSSKLVYIDMKRGKDAELVEEHLIKLGARVEAFLTADINYVISSFGPSKVEDVQKCSDENPNSPINSVASPFSCIPSPSAPGAAAAESKKSAVSRGKALAHLARSKHKTSTVVTNAEKMGVKVISVEGLYYDSY